MIIDTAATTNTKTYYYSTKSERFGENSTGLNHGFVADKIIIVDADKTAQELDVIFDKVLFNA
jgi:hypothetical protein